MENNQIKRQANQEKHAKRSIFIPKVLQWIIRSTFLNIKNELLKEDKEGVSRINFAKAEGLIESFLKRHTQNTETGQNPTMALCPEVSNFPYWNKGDSHFFDQLKDSLNDSFEFILAEYESNSQSEPLEKLSNTYKGEVNDNRWRRYVLSPNMSFGKFNDNARKKFPKTIALLATHGKRLASAAFYAMEPGVVLPLHTDSTNFFIVSHTGIRVPSNCAFEVNNEVCELHTGETHIFDQSFTHSAWNKGDQLRVTLVLFFVHPDITDEELDMFLSFRDKVKLRAMFFSPLILMEMLFSKLFQNK